MDEQTLVIIFFGSLVVAFAFFASYMADRQREREKKEKKEKKRMKQARGRASAESNPGSAPEQQQLL
jgi:preprotein translocase subunit YajC